jgi:peptide/nickel transport system permease protein
MTVAAGDVRVLSIDGDTPLPPRRASLRKLAVRHSVGVAAFVVVCMLVLLAVAAPLLATHSPTAYDGLPLEDPSLSHPFGTDNNGRDVFSRTVYGARVSLGIALLAVGLGTVVGLFVGLQSGYFGGAFDRTNTFILDVGLSFPGILPLLVVVAAWGPSFWVLTLAIAFTSVPIVMRVVRGAVIKEKESQYIEAARALGATDSRIILRHLLPNVAPLVIVLASAGIPAAILAEASLSFLGLGIRPPTPSWGGDLSGDARSFFELQPWMAIAPGGALSLAVLAFNLMGDTLRDLLDPRMRRA